MSRSNIRYNSHDGNNQMFLLSIHNMTFIHLHEYRSLQKAPTDMAVQCHPPCTTDYTASISSPSSIAMLSFFIFLQLFCRHFFHIVQQILQLFFSFSSVKARSQSTNPHSHAVKHSMFFHSSPVLSLSSSKYCFSLQTSPPFRSLDKYTSLRTSNNFLQTPI